MPSLIKMVRRPRLRKLTLVGWIRGVEIYVHWSVMVIAAIMLAGAIRRPLLTLVGMLSYLSMLLIHECGHMIVAQRRKYKVWCIEMYPIFGFCRLEDPWSKFDRCMIAWGGVVAQAVIAVPLVAWVMIFGYTRFEPINAVFGILGFYSLCTAAFNLLPISPLDGATAWGLIPAWLARRKERQRKQAMRYRSPR